MGATAMTKKAFQHGYLPTGEFDEKQASVSLVDISSVFRRGEQITLIFIEFELNFFLKLDKALFQWFKISHQSNPHIFHQGFFHDVTARQS
tara:strand:- start:205 stop:477 length:273 start_codon:yes stop_codon:yes gene_type:complete